MPFGIFADLDNFDFDARCRIQGFNLTYIARRQDPIEVSNMGERYGQQARILVNRAKPGDTYCFYNVRAKCPGDVVSRKINSLFFMIK